MLYVCSVVHVKCFVGLAREVRQILDVCICISKLLLQSFLVFVQSALSACVGKNVAVQLNYRRAYSLTSRCWISGYIVQASVVAQLTV